MNQPQKNNPLHGITLEQVVTQLAEHYGWEKLAEKIDINCFKKDPLTCTSISNGPPDYFISII